MTLRVLSVAGRPTCVTIYRDWVLILHEGTSAKVWKRGGKAKKNIDQEYKKLDKM
jgi:hypothetical protein